MSKRKSFRPPSRYNIFQKELSGYLKETGKKSPVKFHELSKQLYRQLPKDLPNKRVGDAINGLFKKFTGELQSSQLKDVQYTPSFRFFYVRDNIGIMPVYEGKKISVYFQDEEKKFEFKEGSSDAFLDWFYDDSGFYQYLREKYNQSPTAIFYFRNGDKESVVYDVVVETSEDIKERKEDVAPSEKPTPTDIKQNTLEIEKEKTKQLHSVERSKLYDLLQSGLITKDEFNKLIKATQ